MAFGWTINYYTLPDKDTIIVISIMTLVMHILIAGLTSLDRDEHHKYHDYSGIQGFILVALRLILFAIFIFALNISRKEVKRSRKKFFNLFTFAGSFYVLGFPIVYFISFLCAAYVRNRVIIFTHFMFQTFS
mmetsp:Transcript_34972/g.34649  ORF Transcript_34972/g.34649 Transcript_34972/m.34649 type:complete len:132 (+) Transcript_34972:798-1193(+)